VPRQRLYIDESGDHTVAAVTPANWDKRYLCLFGCSLEFDYCGGEFQKSFEDLKRTHFSVEMDEQVILHREEICRKSGTFACLRDPKANRAFQEHLLRLVRGAKFRAFAVVIDKQASQNRHYGLADSNPYHISLAIMMERYCGWLNFTRQQGDVMAESRGGTEDKQLKAAYKSICTYGSRWREADFFTRSLTTCEIKVKPKAANVCGLQLSDQLAYGARRRILEEHGISKPLTGFEKELADLVEAKYNRHYYDGRVAGYGKMFIT